MHNDRPLRHNRRKVPTVKVGVRSGRRRGHSGAALAGPVLLRWL